MKKTEIKAGVTYSTKTGNAARKVLQITPQVGEGSLPRPRWYGGEYNAPGLNELLVEYEQTRGSRIGSREVVFLSQFATWAAKVDDGNKIDHRDKRIEDLEAECAALKQQLDHTRKAYDDLFILYTNKVSQAA